MTNEFLVRYASGIETTFHSTCESVEHFVNEHFGSTWETAKEAGASVVMKIEEAAQAVEAEVKELVEGNEPDTTTEGDA